MACNAFCSKINQWDRCLVASTTDVPDVLAIGSRSASRPTSHRQWTHPDFRFDTCAQIDSTPLWRALHARQSAVSVLRRVAALFHCCRVSIPPYYSLLWLTYPVLTCGSSAWVLTGTGACTVRGRGLLTLTRVLTSLGSSQPPRGLLGSIGPAVDGQSIVWQVYVDECRSVYDTRVHEARTVLLEGRFGHVSNLAVSSERCWVVVAGLLLARSEIDNACFHLLQQCRLWRVDTCQYIAVTALSRALTLLLVHDIAHARWTSVSECGSVVNRGCHSAAYVR